MVDEKVTKKRKVVEEEPKVTREPDGNVVSALFEAIRLAREASIPGIRAVLIGEARRLAIQAGTTLAVLDKSLDEEQPSAGGSGGR